MNIRESLYELQDPAYRAFQSALIPNVDPETVVGVRMPALRKFASTLSCRDAKLFMEQLPHALHEENNLHGLLINRIKDAEAACRELSRFLPYVDNWATCDMIRPKCFRSRPAVLLSYIELWLKSSHAYAVRFAMEMLMVHYLEDGFDPIYPEWIAGAESEEYYINMMRAWYFATALASQYQAVIPFLEQRRLDAWTHRMTIRKAVESFRISNEIKIYLRSLKY